MYVHEEVLYVRNSARNMENCRKFVNEVWSGTDKSLSNADVDLGVSVRLRRNETLTPDWHTPDVAPAFYFYSSHNSFLFAGLFQTNHISGDALRRD